MSQARDGDSHTKHVMQLPMCVSHHTHTCAILFGINLHSIVEVSECSVVRRSQASMLWGGHVSSRLLLLAPASGVTLARLEELHGSFFCGQDVLHCLHALP